MAIGTTLQAGAPVKSPIIVSQSAIPVGIPSSGSIGNNGALTVTTAFPVTYTGIYLYFPANAISSGSAAGLYWTVMSSTTAGTIYNNTYTSGDPTAPLTLTSFVTTGPGAYTQTTAEVTLRSNMGVTTLMGPTGRFMLLELFSIPTNANTKTLKNKYGSTTFLNQTPTTNLVFRAEPMVINSSITTQLFPAATSGLSYGSGFSGTAFGTGAENTATDLAVTTTGQLAAATDYIVSNVCDIRVMPT